jgi:hypothetical protein
MANEPTTEGLTRDGAAFRSHDPRARRTGPARIDGYAFVLPDNEVGEAMAASAPAVGQTDEYGSACMVVRESMRATFDMLFSQIGPELDMYPMQLIAALGIGMGDAVGLLEHQFTVSREVAESRDDSEAVTKVMEESPMMPLMHVLAESMVAQLTPDMAGAFQRALMRLPMGCGLTAEQRVAAGEKIKHEQGGGHVQ